jgi:hypothetical protein
MPTPGNTSVPEDIVRKGITSDQAAFLRRNFAQEASSQGLIASFQETLQPDGLTTLVIHFAVRDVPASSAGGHAVASSAGGAGVGAAPVVPVVAPSAPAPPRATPPAPAAPPSAVHGATSNFVLGALSARFETGGRGSTTVSGGVGDPGGVSYGAYQMKSKPSGGTVAQFVSHPDFPFRNDFAGLIPGSPAFSAKWKDVATRFQDTFKEAEHEFIKRTHYDPLCAKTKTDDGVDIGQCSHAMQDVVWSTAVQHGPNANIVHLALGQMHAAGNFDLASPQFERNAINAIYAERGRKDASGTLVHFSKSSAAVQDGVAKRFVEERTDALKMLDAGA